MAEQTQARYAFVTLLTSDSYLPGALTAVHSLLDVEGTRPDQPFDTVCLVTPATVGQDAIKALNKTFDHVVGVAEITTSNWANLDLLGRKDLFASLTKLHLFRLTQYERAIFFDADTLILRPVSHLFSLSAPFSAAPDSGWPDSFNSGFMVTTPSAETFDGLIHMMSDRGSWDGGDQGLLNDFFPDWTRLSFTYNVTPSAYYTYAPAYKRHGPEASVIHFIGARKPWHRQTRDTYVPDAAQTDYYGLVQKWFDVYERHFGTVSTVLVADRVAKPPASFKSTYSELRPHTPSPVSTPTVVAPVPVRPNAPAPAWDPSRSSPPRAGAPQMANPINEHYENEWDRSRSATPSQRFQIPTSYPPPPKETHEWYKNVMGAPPDPSLVRAVFPWESQAPRRQFPHGSSPPPAAEPTSPPPQPAATFVPASERQFVNAWDSIPGIGRYAKSLAKVSGGGGGNTGTGNGRGSSKSAAGDDLGGRTSSLSEPTRSDASSRDGDDEDEDDESGDSEERDRVKIVFKQRTPSAGPPGSASGSATGSATASGTTSPTKMRRGGSGGAGSSSSPQGSYAPLASPRLREDHQGSPQLSQQHHHHHLHHQHHPSSGGNGAPTQRRSPLLPTSALPSMPSPTSPGGTGQRFPTSPSPRLAAQAARNHAAAQLSGTGDGPPVLRATRVFSAETDTTVVKEQGLAALQRFVENMERGSSPTSPGGNSLGFSNGGGPGVNGPPSGSQRSNGPPPTNAPSAGRGASR